MGKQEKRMIQKRELGKVEEYQKHICRAFAEECVDVIVPMAIAEDERRRLKIKSQIFMGKMGEFKVYNYLIDKGKTPLPPDVIIYKGAFKRYGFDILSFPDSLIHVKSCTYNKKYSTSWLFQPEDKVTIAPTDKDFVSLVVHKGAGGYMYLVDGKDLVNLYKTTMKGDKEKKVIFESDLKNIFK
jgi:hypothetical protein